MEPDRRRRIAREMAAAVDAIPVGVDGRGDFGLSDLVATMRLETALIGECTDAIERAHAIEKVLDGALVALGGWRHITRAELRGDAAGEFCRLFADQTIGDK